MPGGKVDPRYEQRQRLKAEKAKGFPAQKADNPDVLIARNVFCFNEKDNGGESLTITTEFFHNGDDPPFEKTIYTNQEITLQSYANSASFNLAGCQLTPSNLRELANQLERELNKGIDLLEAEKNLLDIKRNEAGLL